jgi:thiamine-phosphate pyrophosphorylase
MHKYISKFHYLTQDLSGSSHLAQVMKACENGANWIQYRCFSKDEEQLLDDINRIAEVCDDWGTTLIVTDHISLISKADIQGIHIEDMNADFKSIRKEIGPDKTLGASANTIEDIQRIADSKVVDYIGCGPLRITLTKPNDYPLLGVNGYQLITDEMKKRGISIPLLAVGGVTEDDIDALLNAGVYGVAVSAAVNLSPDPSKAFKEIYKKLH